MTPRTQLAALAVAAALPLFATAAGAEKVQTEHDASVDFSSLHTYRWKTDLGPGPRELDGPIRAAARETLAERGLREVKDGETADLVLEYNAGLADQLAAGFALDVDWWGRLVVVPGGDSNVTAGLVFLLTRSSGGEPVWTGWLVQRATNENALVVLRERAPKFAKKILSSYPPKAPRRERSPD